MKETNGNLHKNRLNNTSIQEKEEMRLNRQLLKFMEKSLLTALLDTYNNMLIKIEIIIQCKEKLSTHHVLKYVMER